MKLVQLFKKGIEAVKNKSMAVFWKMQVFFWLAISSQMSLAQVVFNNPEVAVTGLDGNQDPMQIFFIVFRYLGQGVIWLIMILTSFVMLKNIMKSINKVRRDEDGKWAEVVGDVVGNVVIMVLIIALGLWVNSFLGAPAAP